MTSTNTSAHSIIERDSETTPIVLPVVGDFLLVDQGDSYGCVEYSGEVSAINGTIVTIDGITEDLNDVCFWAVLV